MRTPESTEDCGVASAFESKLFEISRVISPRWGRELPRHRLAGVLPWPFRPLRGVMGISQCDPAAMGRPAWNARKHAGAERERSKVRQIWSIRFFLDRERRMRDSALFDLAIDSKLRGCDLVQIQIAVLVAFMLTRHFLCPRLPRSDIGSFVDDHMPSGEAPLPWPFLRAAGPPGSRRCQ